MWEQTWKLQAYRIICTNQGFAQWYRATAKPVSRIISPSWMQVHPNALIVLRKEMAGPTFPTCTSLAILVRKASWRCGNVLQNLLQKQQQRHKHGAIDRKRDINLDNSLCTKKRFFFLMLSWTADRWLFLPTARLPMRQFGPVCFDKSCLKIDSKWLFFDAPQFSF